MKKKSNIISDATITQISKIKNIEMKMNDATITCVLHEKKCQTLVSRVTPLQKPINFKENYATFIESII